MKKLIALILAMLMVCAWSAASADAAYAVLRQRIATRSGPGTEYFEPGSFLAKGNIVTVHTKVWDDRNEIWWVQVEFNAGGDVYRAYTGSWRMDVDLTNVPQERSLGTVRVTSDADVFAGPGWDYVMWNDTVYRGTYATLLEVEGGYGHIECWNSAKGQMWRVWAPLRCLSCYNQYSSCDDTYPAYSGSTGMYDDADDSYTWSEPAQGSCWITANSGNARSGPGTEYRTLGTVWYGESYSILDTAVASNGVTWYEIGFNGGSAWISSGLTNHGKW